MNNLIKLNLIAIVEIQKYLIWIKLKVKHIIQYFDISNTKTPL